MLKVCVDKSVLNVGSCAVCRLYFVTQPDGVAHALYGLQFEQGGRAVCGRLVAALCVGDMGGREVIKLAGIERVSR